MFRSLGCGGGYLKGSTKIRLKDLADKAEINTVCKIELLSQRIIPVLNVTIQVRTPLVSKEYITKTQKVFKVVKTYSAFQEIEQKNVRDFNLSTIQLSNRNPDKKDSTKNTSIKKTTTVSSVKENEPNQNKLKIKHSQTEIKEMNNILPENKIKDPIDKSIFSENELSNPDFIDNLNTMEVLDFKEKKLNQKFNTIEGRIPASLRQELITIRVKKKVLMNQLEEGAISIENYLSIIKKQFEHDKLLHSYFEQQNEKEKSAKVAFRLPLLLKEIDTINFQKQQQQNKG